MLNVVTCFSKLDLLCMSIFPLGYLPLPYPLVLSFPALNNCRIAYGIMRHHLGVRAEVLHKLFFLIFWGEARGSYLAELKGYS